VEGYQKSNLKGDGLSDLHYGVIIKDIAPEFNSADLQVLDVKDEQRETAEFPLPTLGAGKTPINSRVGFEGQTFPPAGWTLNLLPGNVCRPDAAAALKGSRGLLCQDVPSSQGTLIRAGLCFALPNDRLVRPMSWRLRADIKPAELQMDKGLVIHPLAFLVGDDLVAAACLRKIKNDEYIAGVLIRSAEGLCERDDSPRSERVVPGCGPPAWDKANPPSCAHACKYRTILAGPGFDGIGSRPKMLVFASSAFPPRRAKI